MSSSVSDEPGVLASAATTAEQQRLEELESHLSRLERQLGRTRIAVEIACFGIVVVLYPPIGAVLPVYVYLRVVRMWMARHSVDYQSRTAIGNLLLAIGLVASIIAGPVLVGILLSIR